MKNHLIIAWSVYIALLAAVILVTILAVKMGSNSI